MLSEDEADKEYDLGARILSAKGCVFWMDLTQLVTEHGGIPVFKEPGFAADRVRNAYISFQYFSVLLPFWLNHFTLFQC